MYQISDSDYGLDYLIKKCGEDAKKRGWQDTPISFGDAMTLLHSEISEMFEEYRNHRAMDEIYHNKEFAFKGTPEDVVSSKPEGIPIEMADLLIRMCHYCSYFGIPIHEGLRQKMAYNDTRPYRHGNKKA